MSKHNIKDFLKHPFGFAESGETKVYVLYALTTAVLIPVVNFFIYDLSNPFNYTIVSIVLSFYFLLLSFLVWRGNYFVKNNIEKCIIYGFYVVTLSAFLLYYGDKENTLSFFTYVLTVFAITIALQKRIATIIYVLWVLALYFFTFIITEDYTNFKSFFILFFIITIAYIISYSRYYLFSLLKKSNDYLQISEKTYRAFFDESQDMIIVISLDGEIIDINKKYLKVSGVNKEDLLNKNYENITDEDALENSLFESIKYFIKEKGMSEINFQSELIFGKKKIPTITRLIKNYYFGDPVCILFFRDITEIVENEIKLKKGRENLSLVLDNIDSIVYYVFIDKTDQKHIRYISPQIRKMLGITVDEFITHMKSSKILELYHPDDIESIKKTSQQLTLHKNKQVLNYRIKNVLKDQYLWVEEKIYPKFNEKGRHVANFGIITDVSERVENENRIKASEKKYKQLFDKNMAGVFQTELSGKLINFNESFMKIFGYSDPSEVEKLTADDFYFTKEDRASYLEKLMKSRSITNYFVKLKKKTGEIIWANLNSNIVDFEGKNIIEGTLIDVTESKKYEQQLLESEKQYKMLFSKSNDGIMIFINHQIEKANDKILEFFNIEISELEDLRIEEFINKINSDDPQDLLEKFKVIHNEENQQFDCEITINNTTKYFEISTTSFVINNNKVTQLIFRDITQRREYEIAVNMSRRSFQNMIENVPDSILIVRNKKVLYYNPAFENLVGSIQKDESISIKNWFVDNDQNEIDSLINDVENGDYPVYKELKLLSKNGKIKDVGIQVVKTIYNAEPALIIIMQDVSYRYELSKEKLKLIIEKETNKNLQKEIIQHKETQLKLAELEKYTRSIINSSTDTIIATDSHGRISEINQQSIDKFGFKEEDVVDQSPAMFFKNRDLFKEITKKVNSEGSYEGEFIGVKKDGSNYPGYITTSRLINESGDPIGYMAIIRDISSQKETEQLLKEQNSKINAIFNNNSNILIWTINKKMEITSFNDILNNELERIINHKIKIGDNFYDIITKRMTPSMLEDMEHFIQSAFEGRAQEMEGYLKYDEDRKLWLETFISPIKLDDEKIEELAFIAHDITDKKSIYNKMKESLDEKEVLLKEVHHRVKNNLQVISSILNLQSSYVHDENTLNILRESQNRIKSMSFIHENLYQTENFSSINFSEYIINLTNNLIHTYQMTETPIDLEQKADKITLNLDQAIPCGLIVNELVSNALKYAYNNIKNPKLNVEINENQNIITIIVADNGVGLPKDLDIHNTDSLGLQLVFTLIEQIDGKIEVKNEKGTRYFISFEKQ